ncbi:MAG TPA: methyltransferase domain-containing protein [Quisquiliibacterium sp.]|nr:methyltransferase domain-containing protein [Quisquiliibacterium sp.]
MPPLPQSPPPRNRDAACRPARRRLLASALAGAALGPRVLQAAPSLVEEVPYVQTPQNVVDAILALADVGPGDRLVDLGSGDGRIVITAAQRLGASGLGVEIDPALVGVARKAAEAAGVGERARFVTQDLFETDISSATVVTMYLLPQVNLALRPRLLETLAPGTRVVSHDWDMGDWEPDRSLTMPAPGKRVGMVKESTLHLWIVPARVDGDWLLQLPPADGAGAAARPRRLRMSFAQAFQRARVALSGEVRGEPRGRGSARISGAKLELELELDGRALRLAGEADGDRIGGSVEGPGGGRWEARRLAAKP